MARPLPGRNDSWEGLVWTWANNTDVGLGASGEGDPSWTAITVEPRRKARPWF